MSRPIDADSAAAVSSAARALAIVGRLVETRLELRRVGRDARAMGRRIGFPRRMTLEAWFVDGMLD